MKYILDFDRVLFDTDRFSADLKSHGLGDMSRNHELLDAVTTAGLKWEAYVYPGVIDFLSQNGDRCEIVSSYISFYRGDNTEDEATLEHFQTEKIIRCGIKKMVHEVHLTNEDKTETLLEIRQQCSEPLVYIDDSPAQIRAVSELGYDHVVWFATARELFTNPNPESGPSFVTETFAEVEHVTSFEAFVNSVTSWKRQSEQST
jgi:hypothetical protein